MRVKRVVILGSTGTIGIKTLEVISRFPGRFRVVGLSAYKNSSLFLKQLKTFTPAVAAAGKKKIAFLKKNLPGRRTKIIDAETGLASLAAMKLADIVVIGISGGAALAPFLAAVESGKTVAPANKEALVMAGDILMAEARRHKARVIPVDSEQSAIFQCLEGQRRRDVHKIHLTASGGALGDVPRSRFDRLRIEDVLNHPRWKMGKKITVDSATLMNKGFEVIEAQKLFGLDVNDIEVVVHPEAIIHSMVSFRDGSVLAQMGVTDMRLPIQYALTYPDRWDSSLRPIDFVKLRQLTFRKPDGNKFPCLPLAVEAAWKGKTYPCVLASADEEAVRAYLDRKISFTDIYRIVAKVLRRHRPGTGRADLNDILAADRWAREEVKRILAIGRP